MEYSEFTWERQSSLSAGAALSAADIEGIARLMAELRELTQSRGSYVAASDFLERFGYDTGNITPVKPEVLAN